MGNEQGVGIVNNGDGDVGENVQEGVEEVNRGQLDENGLRTLQQLVGMHIRPSQVRVVEPEVVNVEELEIEAALRNFQTVRNHFQRSATTCDDYKKAFNGRNDVKDVRFVQYRKLDEQVLFFQRGVSRGILTGIVQFDQENFLRQNICGNSSPQFVKNRFMLREMYFEVTILHLKNEKKERETPSPQNLLNQCMAIGLAPQKYHGKFIGWKDYSIGIHSDNGVVYDNFENWRDKNKDPKYKLGEYASGDVIGCRWDFSSGQVNFTRNGHLLDFSGFRETELATIPSFQRMEKKLYSSVTVFNQGEKEIRFTVNLGEDTLRNPFKFNEFNVRLDCHKIKTYFDIVVVTRI